MNLSSAASSLKACGNKAAEFVEKLQCKETIRFIGGQKYSDYGGCATTAADFSARITSARVEGQGVLTTHFLCTVTERTSTTHKISDYREFPKTKSWPKRTTSRVYSSDEGGSKLNLKATNGEELECTSSERHDPQNPKNITWQRCFYKKNEITALRPDQLAAIYDGRFSVEEAIKIPNPPIHKTCDPQKPGDCPEVEPNIPVNF